jgi:molybdopterin converting factor small subunit
MSKIQILFFATLRDRAGINRTEMDLPEGATVADIKTRLSELYPNIAPLLGHTLVSINQGYAFDDEPVPEKR